MSPFANYDLKRPRLLYLTGATRGIGYETVKLFAAEGAEIIGIARNAERLQAIATAHPVFHGLVGDVTGKTLGTRAAEAVAGKALSPEERKKNCQLVKPVTSPPPARSHACSSRSVLRRRRRWRGWLAALRPR